MSSLFMHDYTQANNLSTVIIVKSLGWQTATITAFSGFHRSLLPKSLLSGLFFLKIVPFQGCFLENFYKLLLWDGIDLFLMHYCDFLFIFEPRWALVWKYVMFRLGTTALLLGGARRQTILRKGACFMELRNSGRKRTAYKLHAVLSIQLMDTIQR